MGAGYAGGPAACMAVFCSCTGFEGCPAVSIGVFCGTTPGPGGNMGAAAGVAPRWSYWVRAVLLGRLDCYGAGRHGCCTFRLLLGLGVVTGRRCCSARRLLQPQVLILFATLWVWARPPVASALALGPTPCRWADRSTTAWSMTGPEDAFEAPLHGTPSCLRLVYRC
jgi:hypothetical protein